MGKMSKDQYHITPPIDPVIYKKLKKIDRDRKLEEVFPIPVLSAAKLEKSLIQHAMKQANGVKNRAAKMLGIRTSALYYKLEKYGFI